MSATATETHTLTDEEILALAEEHYGGEDHIDIDPAPSISRVDDGGCYGAWVQAWVWVEFPDPQP